MDCLVKALIWFTGFGDSNATVLLYCYQPFRHSQCNLGSSGHLWHDSIKKGTLTASYDQMILIS